MKLQINKIQVDLDSENDMFKTNSITEKDLDSDIE